MKKISGSTLLACILFFSCTKSSGPTSQPLSQDSLLVSFTDYLPQLNAKTVETFSYNAGKQLAIVQIHSYDTSGGLTYLDTALYTFSSSSSTIPPAAYDLTWFKDNIPQGNGSTEHHILGYDNQKRIIQDSMSSGTDGYLVNENFSYVNGNIIASQWSPSPLGTGGNVLSDLDTIFLSAGNITRNLDYTPAYGYDSIGNYIVTEEDSSTFTTTTYNTLSNPLFQSAIATSLGPVFVIGVEGDLVSKNLASQQLVTYYYYSPAQFSSVSYTWTTNATGQVIQGIGTDNTTHAVTDIVTYSYH